MPVFVSLFGLRPHSIGGMEALIRESTVALEERGWSSIVVFAGEPAAEVRSYLGLSSLTVKVIPDFDRNPLAALPALYSLLREPSVRCVHFHFTSLLNPIFLVARLKHARCFITAHRSPPENYEPQSAPVWKRAIARSLLSSVDRVFCVSRFIRSQMQATGYFRPEQLYTLYNGVHLPELRALPALRAKYRATHRIPGSVPMILQVGQLIRAKGVEDLLDAVPMVLARFRDARFVFAGDGPDYRYFRERAASLKIEHAVHWAGLDVDPWHSGAFAAADVVCVPSRWQEAFGLTITEGMSHQVPVVATKAGGIGEIVVDGETGFLVDRRAPAQLADRINELLSDAGLRIRMGRAGYKRVNSEFNLTSTVQQMLAVCGVVPSGIRAGAAVAGAA